MAPRGWAIARKRQSTGRGADLTSSSGTPARTPAGTPVGTPVGTPINAPVSTPVSTPIGTSISEPGLDGIEEGSAIREGVRGPNIGGQVPEHPDYRPVIDIMGFTNNEVIRAVTDVFKFGYTKPWLSFTKIPNSEIMEMFRHFNNMYTWHTNLNALMREKFQNQVSNRMSDLLRRARKLAMKAARAAGLDPGADMSVMKSYSPEWIKDDIWDQLVDQWCTEKWLKKSSVNKKNRNAAGENGGVCKHTAGLVSIAEVRNRMISDLRDPGFPPCFLQKHHSWKPR